MAHARKEIRFRQVGFFGRGPGSFQLDVVFLKRALKPFAFRDVARGGEYPLKFPVAIVEGGRVIGNYGFLAVPGARRELIIGDLASGQDSLDTRLGPVRISEIVL